MGASSVLLFAVPASPLAQPWSIVGGNFVSALVGIGCAHWIPDPALAATLAVGLAIIAMFQLRCLHPPGGAMGMPQQPHAGIGRNKAHRGSQDHQTGIVVTQEKVDHWQWYGLPARITGPA